MSILDRQMLEKDREIAELQRKIEELNKEKERLIYEKNRLHANNKVNDYLHGWAGKRLLEKYDLSHTSKWEIFGEDPNCDFGGSHHQPHLAYVEGTLEKAIEYAVGLSGFYSWGSGGDIKEIKEHDIIRL